MRLNLELQLHRVRRSIKTDAVEAVVSEGEGTAAGTPERCLVQRFPRGVKEAQETDGAHGGRKIDVMISSVVMIACRKGQVVSSVRFDGAGPGGDFASLPDVVDGGGRIRGGEEADQQQNAGLHFALTPFCSSARV